MKKLRHEVHRILPAGRRDVPAQPPQQDSSQQGISPARPTSLLPSALPSTPSCLQLTNSSQTNSHAQLGDKGTSTEGRSDKSPLTVVHRSPKSEKGQPLLSPPPVVRSNAASNIGTPPALVSPLNPHAHNFVPPAPSQFKNHPRTALSGGHQAQPVAQSHHLPGLQRNTEQPFDPHRFNPNVPVFPPGRGFPPPQHHQPGFQSNTAQFPGPHNPPHFRAAPPYAFPGGPSHVPVKSLASQHQPNLKGKGRPYKSS